MNHDAVFRKFYDDHSEMVFNLALNYLQNQEDAEEITQDVFLRVHRRLNGFRHESSPRTWIYRIALNCCHDLVKSRRRQKRFGLHTSLFGADNHEKAELPAEMNHPGIALEDREACERLFDAINTLPHQQKTALLLKTTEELSQAEIAAVMQLSVKAVESLLSRARAGLRTKLNTIEGLSPAYRPK